MDTATPTYHPDAVLDSEALSGPWFTDLLRTTGNLKSGEVIGAAATEFGTGQMARSVRFDLQYSVAGAGPATLVGKFPSHDPNSRTFGADRGLYETEVRFYRELAPELPVSVPKPLHAAISEGGAFTLILEDLAPATIIDQIAGATAEQMALAVEQLALLHAATWGRSDLARHRWLRGVVEGYTVVVDQLDDLTARFAAAFGDLVPEDDLTELRRMAQNNVPWKRRLHEVRCLWHQDYRLDNLLYDARGGTTPLAVVDWQTVGMANGVIDLPYVVGSGLTVTDRQANEKALVQLYHEVLVANGVSDYTFADCWQDYRVLAAHGLAALAVGAVSVQRTPRGDLMWRTWAQRHASQTRDLDTFDQLARER